MAERSSDPLFTAGAVRCPRDTSRSCTRRPPRSASSATTPPACASRSAPTSSSGSRCVPSGRRRSWSRTPAGRASASSPRRTPIHVSGEELGRTDGPFVIAALNGDVDNHADLRALEGLRFAPDITTDAKVIPTLVSAAPSPAAPTPWRRSGRRSRRSRARSRSSRTSACDPRRLLLAQRGSGQALYVGAAAERTSSRASPTAWWRSATATSGSTARRCSNRATPRRRGRSSRSTLSGVDRRSYDGTRLPVDDGESGAARDHDARRRPRRRSPLPAQGDHRVAGVVPQDAARPDRRAGRPVGRPARPRHVLPRDARVAAVGWAPAGLRHRSGHRRSRRPGRRARAAPRAGDAASWSRRCSRRSCRGSGSSATWATRSSWRSRSRARPPTPTARSTSRGRAAPRVVAIVNRRQSDLVDKSDGVLYTSDGRDVEMSVASTKAFYAQVAAGFLLAFALAAELGVDGDGAAAYRHELLTELRALPGAMQQVLARRDAIAAAANATCSAAGPGPSWATASTASPPRRSGSSSPSSATSRSAATSPRTRSTSTCRPSR
ncbi:MAG: hypothetical protein KatS3mg010_1287 [Acidimicrobiia bacterium]|nr:MAG: hypothetical protein KatS3mg010_1287 [Acidimicrobiia bacterium]